MNIFCVKQNFVDRASPVIKGQKLVKTHQKVQVSTCHYVDRYPSITRGLHTKLVLILFYTFIFWFLYLHLQKHAMPAPTATSPTRNKLHPKIWAVREEEDSANVVKSESATSSFSSFSAKLQRRYFWKRNKISNVEILLCVLAC